MNYAGTNIIPLRNYTRYPAMRIKPKCNCGGHCSTGLLGADAHGVTKLNTLGTRATAVKKFLDNVMVRTAGGQYLGDDALTYVVQEMAKLPETALQYLTLPGITYTVAKQIWNTGKQSAQSIAKTINDNPQLKQTVKDLTQKIIKSGGDILDMVVNPIKSTSMLITWLPYIVIGILAIAAIFAFKNPGSVSPRKVSVF